MGDGKCEYDETGPVGGRARGRGTQSCRREAALSGALSRKAGREAERGRGRRRALVQYLHAPGAPGPLSQMRCQVAPRAVLSLTPIYDPDLAAVNLFYLDRGVFALIRTVWEGPF